jgi:deoxyribodipyrimidine photo-lyase
MGTGARGGLADTGSHKPHLFNAENVERYAPAHWHSPGTVVDQRYEVMDRPLRTCAQNVFAHGATLQQVVPAVDTRHPRAASGARVAESLLTKDLP